MRYLKQINRLLLLGGVSTIPGLTKAQQANDERPMNVLMILVDDLKPNLGCYGDDVAVSPNIDRLAEQGVRFEMAYCNQAVSVASRYNLLTGARSTSTGLYDFGREFRDIYPDGVTLPQFFMQAGYHSEAIGKVFHVGHGNTDDKASWSIPHHQDKLIEYLLPESTDRQLTREEALFENTRLFFPETRIGNLPRGAAWEAPDVVDDAYADGRVARHAIDRLRELKKTPDQPFFMAVGFVRPHLPFSAPKKYWDMYDPATLPMPEYEKDAENAPRMATKRGGEIDQFKPIPAGQYVYPDSLTRKLIHGYYASMSYMDAQLGRLLDELERLEMLDNTIIVFWGDHGWHLGDHGYWTKHTNYEQANRIPLIVVAPGVTTPGESTGQLAESVDIYPTLAETDMYVQVDKEAFLKIISNLINNAIQYCDTFVNLNAFIDQNEWFHLVIDNDGEPIPDKYRQEIFKPFVHLDKNQDRRVNGTGIGLALSRSLAGLHKGKLELDDSVPSTRFHLALPVGSIKEITENQSSSEPGKGDKEMPVDKGNRSTILLVEDDLELLHFEEKFLSLHYHVLTAKNGEEALAVLRESSVNLVVCDVMMPKMDGFEFTKRVKSDIEFSHIPVILLTAKVNVESKVQGFETGADAYIDKPFSLEILLAQIANLLQNREKLRETFLKHPYIGVNSMALTKSDDEFIRKLHDIVHENLDNSEFIVEEMAEQFNMSRASFYRKIKGVLNLTPTEYIRAERLKKQR